MGVTVRSCTVEKVAATQGEVALAMWGMPSLGGNTAGLKGTVVATAEDGAELTLALSRLDGEEAWTLDGLSVNGVPMWQNGYGARYLRTKQLNASADNEVAVALEAAAERAAA